MHSDTTQIQRLAFAPKLFFSYSLVVLVQTQFIGVLLQEQN